MPKQKAKRRISKGKCGICDDTLVKTVMLRHIQTHTQSKDTSAKGISAFQMLLQGRYLPEYWMYIQVPVNFTLESLDNFLRDIWLECCGHLSAFTIEGGIFNSSPESSLEDRSMDIPLEKVLKPGVVFTYEYDFGTTTELVGKVVEVVYDISSEKDIKLLARNEPPDVFCMHCQDKVVHICTECMYDKSGLLCVKHKTGHKHDEDMLLPIVNSPRMGECGYTG